MADSITYVPNEPALFEMLNSSTGEVADDLEKRGQRVLSGARVDVGVETGALLADLHVSMEGGRTGPTAYIGSNLDYALAHHEGTQPHEIQAQPGRALVFSYNGIRIFRHKVHHPGTQANPFLQKNLYRALG
jgi:hypothetical protein